MRVEWGRPTLVLRDPDGNELFFWIPDSEWANLPPDLPSPNELIASPNVPPKRFNLRFESISYLLDREH